MHSRLLPLLAPLLLLLACKPKPEPTPPTDDGHQAVAPVEAEPTPGLDPAPAPEPHTCNRPETFGPVIVSATQYAARYGATATAFSQLKSSKEQPAEVCGIPAGVELLLDLRCDDGSNPFSGRQAAHASRAGNVGPGGRCNTIIDRYVVPCPEATYDVYIDSYLCADASAFR